MKAFSAILIVAFALGCTTAQRTGESAARYTDEVEIQKAEAGTPISVQIRGEVRQPDSYSLRGGIKLKEAIMTKAGGFTEDGFTRKVWIIRKDRRMFYYDLRKVIEGSKADPVLHDGDAVLVPLLMRPRL